MTEIHIVGLGVSSVSQVTREAEHAIRASNEVLYLDTGVATRRFLEDRCTRVTSLHNISYRECDHRLNAYYHMAATVIEAAMARAPVAFAVHGHPAGRGVSLVPGLRYRKRAGTHGTNHARCLSHRQHHCRI